MRATIGSLLIAFLLLAVMTQTALATPAQPTPEMVEALVDAVVQGQLDATGVPGATVAVVLGGETILAKGYGVADVEDGRIADADTLFRIGSIGKLFTFTAVMQLVEQGRLDLHEDINTYLDFELPHTLEYHPFRGDPGPITLAHLLTHTAGFEDARGNGYFLDAADMPSLADTMRERMPARIFRPGEAVAYSNYGAALAGYIVERVAAQPFAEYVEEHVFAPLSMDRSTFAQPLPLDLAPHLARASRVVGGELQRDRFVFTAMTPAGSTSTTASDMARFVLAHLGDGGAVLAPETLESMHTRQFGHHPRLDGMAFGFVERTVNGQRTLFHGGDIFSFQSGLFLLPEHDVGLFVSYSGGGYGEPLTLFHTFLDTFYPDAASEPPRQDAGAADRSRAFVTASRTTRRHRPVRRRGTSLLPHSRHGQHPLPRTPSPHAHPHRHRHRHHARPSSRVSVRAPEPSSARLRMMERAAPFAHHACWHRAARTTPPPTAASPHPDAARRTGNADMLRHG